MGYKLLGYAVWQGGKWYLRRKFPGAGRKLATHGDSDEPAASIVGLADELVSEPIDTSELLRILVRNGDRIPRAVHG